MDESARRARRAEIVRLDKARVWHPYTEMRAYIDEVDPLVIERAEGARLYDLDGRSYLDGNASWWAAALGHGHPRLLAALAAQASALAHCSLAGIAHEPAARLADELCAVAPSGLERVFFSDDGSTAVEAAVKMAVQLWRQSGRPARRRFLALEGAFHGETVGAASLGGVEVFRRPFAGVLFDCLRVPPPWHPDAHDLAFDALRRALAADTDEIAAVVIEPLIQAAAGMRTYHAEFLREVRAECDRHDVLLVADEVFTGYGRTGSMWAVAQAGVRPDLLCVAKGFTGGMLPMAATLATRRVFDAFTGARERAFLHGHTYCGNPLGAAVAREVLAVLRDEQVLEGLGERAQRIAAAFAALAEQPGVLRARSLGMVGALDLAGEEGYGAATGWRVYDEARARGAYLRPLGHVVYVTPPLNIALAELDELLDIVRRSVGAACS